jgi:deazaflavin-dependent oxidoreductase (nitroreductase family)
MAEPSSTPAAAHSNSPTTTVALKALHTRWLVRLPISLYRLRLGFIFGRRLVMLQHYGRSTGKRRYVVLEIIGHTLGTYFVVSGFGERSDWVKNVSVYPHISITVGSRHPMPATARRLLPTESAAILDDYARLHPRAWRALEPVLSKLNPGGVVQSRDVVVYALTLRGM